MKLSSLEEIIRRYVQLPSTPTTTGWYSVLCPICSDHGRKGLRAGFKFDNNIVAYHCFNCGPQMNTVFNPDRLRHEGQIMMPPRMIKVLKGFNIPEEEWQQVLFTLLSDKYTGKKEIFQQKQQLNIEPKQIPLPPVFYFLKDADQNDKWATIAKEYLKYERGIDSNSYPFMLSRITNDIRFKKWKGRVIIPIYKGKTLIFYIGKDLTNKALKKYESPSFSKECVFYGFDQIMKNTSEPLFIVEGWFDAFAINTGVAILGNQLSDSQLNWLRQSSRPKVYIPDKHRTGIVAAKQILKEGWSISTPDIGDCKDISEATQTYGLLYVLKTINDFTFSGFEAEVRLNLYCK